MKTLLICLTLVPSLALANTAIQLGAPFPATTIEQLGELHIEQQSLSYAPWSSKQFEGKIILLQAMAGRTRTKELNKPMMDALKQAQFPHAQYQTVTIVNLNDRLWGTGGLVKQSVKKNKQGYPYSSFVIDKKGDAFSQ